MPISIKGALGSLLGVGDFSTPNGRENMSAKQLEKEKLDYQAEPIYFQRREDFGKVSEENPGTKFNRAQMDAIVYARNTGVSMGLFSKEDGDMFIATQLREARNDFGVNPTTPSGKMQTISINQGKTKEAADRLYGVNADMKDKNRYQAMGQGSLEYLPADRTIEKGVELQPLPRRVGSEKIYSPYTEENMTPEQFQSNAKLALLVYLSKKDKGESADKVAKDWNGKGVNKDLGANANTHLKEVIKVKEDLLHPNNEALRSYISERLSDENSIYRVKKKK